MFPIVINDGTKELPNEDIYYIIAKEGIFLKKKLGIMESIAPVQNISILNSIESSAKMHIKKIPEKLIAQIITFFKEVYETYHSEANVLLFYNEETKKYKIFVPKQEVSGTSVNYDRKVTINNYNMIGTIHSHANFSAFHSGTDKDDEKTFDGLHITIGNVNNDEISISSSIVANGKRIINDPLEYINGIKMIKDISYDEPIYITKRYKFVNNQLIMDEEKSKKSTISNKKFDKRYVCTVPSEKINYNKNWIAQVEKKTYKTFFDNKKHPHTWGNHYDNYLWIYDQLRYENNQNVHPLNVGPYKQAGIQFPQDHSEEKIPCLTCQYKNIKLSLDEEEEFQNDDVYKCMNCDSILNTEEIEPKCALCDTDEYLVLLDNEDLKNLGLEEINKLNNYTCKTCNNSFLRLEKDETCPYCKCLLEENEQNIYDHTTIEYEPTIQNPIKIPQEHGNKTSLSTIQYIKNLFKKEG